MRQWITALVAVAAVGAAARASAAELPVQGVFGEDAADCQAAKDETEGGYIGFDKMSVGAGGEGGCDFTAIRKTGPAAYTLTGLCFGLEGPKRKRQITLVVKGPGEIVYGGTTYRRCPGQ